MNHGDWHHVDLLLITTGNSKHLSVVVDNNTMCLTPVLGTCSVSYQAAAFLQNIILGSTANVATPTALSSASFTGCIRRLLLGSTSVDLRQTLSSPPSSSLAIIGSLVSPSLGCPRDQGCSSQPCANGATCTSTWLGYSCACRENFEGTQCTQGEPRCTLQSQRQHVSGRVNHLLRLL